MGMDAHTTADVRRYLGKWRVRHAETDFAEAGSIFAAYLELVGLAGYLEGLLDETETAA